MVTLEKQKTIITLYEQITKPVCEKFSLTRMEYNIIMFIYDNPQYNTAADIVKEGRLSKSHVSSSLKNLENMGFIVRYFAEGNKKNILISLTEKTHEIVREGQELQKKFTDILFSGFSREELSICRQLLEKIYKNAEYTVEETGKP